MFEKKEKGPSNSFILAMIVLCTLAIILSNYISTKNIAIQVRDVMMELEYQKIGGKENYTIMKELQKREIVGYIEKLKEENPKMVERLRMREAGRIATQNGTTDSYISENDLEKLFQDVSIKGNKDTQISIIEFSDFECSHCQSFHNSGVLEEVLDSYSGSLNLLFKNFPFPDHSEAQRYSQIAKCIESSEGGSAYFSYVDAVFNDKGDDKTCEGYESFSGAVAEEFTQGRDLGINATPSMMLINHDTLEYEMITGNVSKEEVEAVVKGFLK